MGCGRLDLSNIALFREQIEALRQLLMTAGPSPDQARDMDFLLTLGKLFSLVVYGQLIIEKARMEGVAPDLADQIFDFMVRDFSKFALDLYTKPSVTQEQISRSLKMIRKPVIDRERFQRIWGDHVYSLKDTYEMNP